MRNYKSVSLQFPVDHHNFIEFTPHPVPALLPPPSHNVYNHLFPPPLPSPPFFPPSPPSTTLTVSSNTNKSLSNNSAQFCTSPISLSFPRLSSASCWYCCDSFASSAVCFANSASCAATADALPWMSRDRDCSALSWWEPMEVRVARKAVRASVVRWVEVVVEVGGWGVVMVEG